MAVRRLIVEECEFLQGFPRSYTAVPHRGKPAADGPRYKSLGNSWAAPCVAWIGRRIDEAQHQHIEENMTRKLSAHGRVQHTYTLFDVMCASPIEPLPEPKRRHQLTRMYGGLAAIEKGAAPTPDDWAVLSDCVNLMETLVLSGIVADADGLVMDGITALAMTGRRAVKGGQIRLDGPGIVAMRSLLEDYAALLEVLPARTVIDCHRKTERRLREIMKGKRAAHDVEIIQAGAMA